jgi:shikimate kinase
MSLQVVIVGPPGAGKTTVGQLLAGKIGSNLRDTDADVERTAGKPISDIFIEDGEAAFRALERAAVAAALDEHDGVVALGGGAVLDSGTRELLSNRRVVFLDVGLADAASRVGLNRDRPLLIGNPRAQLKKLMDERRPLYRQVATITVDTSGRTPEQVADEVLRHVG